MPMSNAGTTSSEDIVQTLHLSFFGAPAEPEVRSFLTEFVDLENPAAVEALEDAFVTFDAFRLSYANESPENLVRAIYFNLFDRHASPMEIATWTEQLETELEIADLPYTIIGSASEIDREALHAKLFVADYFTDATAEGGYLPDVFTFPELRSNDELWGDLDRLDAAYDTLSLEEIGRSLEDNPLYSAQVGTGDIALMFITQQHGDEPIGTESAMYLLDFLAQDTELAEFLRNEVTVTVVPRVNPDGFARWELEVGGEPGLVDPRLNEAGIDLNRTHDPADPFDIDEAPESVAVNDLVDRIDPDFLFDYHGQGNYRSEDGKLDTMSVLWPTSDTADPEIVAASKRAIVAIDESLEDYDYDQLTLYPGSDNPAIARNGFALSGTPTILVEQRYGQEMFQLTQGLDTDYSALVSALALEGFISMKGIVEAAASGRLQEFDAARAEDIPERSEPVRFADLYTDDVFV